MIFACDQLRRGRADFILTGGVDGLSEYLFRGFSELRLLATDQGHGEVSRPDDQRRNGLVLGEGAGILAFETEGHARSRGETVYGYVRGNSLLGRLTGRGRGWEDLKRSIRMAMEGRENLILDYISGAGNSSRQLDSLEARGVKGALPDQYASVPISSIKSMIGEAISSGGIRMVANVLSIENQFIPPTLNYLIRDPNCDLGYVVNQPVDREIKPLLHLGLSPESCFSTPFIGAPWSS